MKHSTQGFIIGWAALVLGTIDLICGYAFHLSSFFIYAAVVFGCGVVVFPLAALERSKGR